MSSGKRLSFNRILPVLRLRPPASGGGQLSTRVVTESTLEPQDGKDGELDSIEHQDGKGDPENMACGSDMLESLVGCIQRLTLHAGDQVNYGAMDGTIYHMGSDDKAWKHVCTWVGIQAQEAQGLEFPVKPPEPLFESLYMDPVQGLDLYPIDVEGLRHYAGAIPGTVSLGGFAEECADYERCFGSPMNMKILISRNDAPAVTNERVMKQMLYYQQTGGGRELGVNKEADFEDLTDFLVYDHTMWASPHDKYRSDVQTTELYAWINRPDYFCNPAGHSSMAYAMHAPADNGGIGQTNFIWQMVLGYEALRRHRRQLMEIPGLTMPIRSTLDIANKYIRNIKIVIKDRPDISERSRDPGQSIASDLLENFALSDVQLHSRVLEKNMQVLLRFAEAMQWPYIDDVRIESAKLWSRLVNGEVVGAHEWDWVYGLFLPGRYAINKIMNVLVALSPQLSYMQPAGTYESGLILRECSYWRSRTVLGTLFAAMDGVNQSCGWVGRCPSVHTNNATKASWALPSIKRVGQRPIALHNSAQPGDYSEKSKPIKVTVRKDESSGEKWVVPTPPSLPSKATSFEIGKLFTLPAMPFGYAQNADSDPTYEMAVELTINQTPTFASPHYFSIKYNPVFVTPPPCVKGPHAIPQKSAKGCIRDVKTIYHCPGDDEGILVIRAAGKGAELAARAWCIQRGRHALIRHSDTPTCFGCCLKLATSLSAHLSVLIWVG